MSSKRHVLVTAGPTREAIDPVRYLSNESSGRMGFAIAEAAVQAGHRATLIAGPVDLPTPKGVKRVDVVSARDMLAALKEHFPKADALYMAAAVADYRPAKRHRGKWKVKETSADSVSLELVRNPDLVQTIARKKGDRRVIAFALETSNGERRALAKLKAKGADWIVLNDPSALGGGRTTVTVLGADGSRERMDDRTKVQVARRLIALLGK
jgi:phosphopantothenoylcysteine decarboxylase / phosphopantothenate---cysteine ligase